MVGVGSAARTGARGWEHEKQRELGQESERGEAVPNPKCGEVESAGECEHIQDQVCEL